MTVSNNFVPDRQDISGITNANPGVVTTTEPHGYHNGAYVRLVLPGNFGMQQVNEQVYLITILSPTTFSIGVDTSNFDIFSLGSNDQVPQVVPVGEVALTLINAVRNSGNIIPET